MPLMADITCVYTKMVTGSLDYYLGDGKQYLSELHRLARLESKEASETIKR